MIPKIATYPMPTPADFPINRVQWTLQPQRAVLLVHDMQEYFVNFFDVQRSPIPELVSGIRQLITRCHDLGIPVVFTAQPGDQSPTDRRLLTDFWGPGLKADDTQTRILPDLTPTASDIVLTKWRYSAFKRSSLEQWMADQQRDQLIICGVYAHIGCLLTAAEAFMLDIQACLVGDAVADFSQAEHLQALNYLATRCGQVCSVQNVLDQLKPSLPNTSSAGITPVTLSAEHIRRDLACELECQPTDLEPDDDLLLFGLDSVRLMLLQERWAQQGVHVRYTDLVQQPTLRHITQLICGVKTS